MSYVVIFLLINYSLATILLSFILPKVKVNKLFWYSISIAFLAQFAHALFVMILSIEIPYHLFLLISSISMFIAGIAVYMDRRVWIGFKEDLDKLLKEKERKSYYSSHEMRIARLQEKRDKLLKEH